MLLRQQWRQSKDFRFASDPIKIFLGTLRHEKLYFELLAHRCCRLALPNPAWVAGLCGGAEGSPGTVPSPLDSSEYQSFDSRSKANYRLRQTAGQAASSKQRRIFYPLLGGCLESCMSLVLVLAACGRRMAHARCPSPRARARAVGRGRLLLIGQSARSSARPLLPLTSPLGLSSLSLL
jgi:hypothetical protein